MVNPPFDINYFLSSCTNLEKSYEHLLKEKKLYELKLNQALISLQEINEKYEEERKKINNLSSYLKSCKEKHDKVVLEYKEKINDLIKQNEEREKKNKVR
ncbi:hypothetical protein C923_04864 [Plasmodium falciparum UGT5.1]|uniref:Uncharacterized protein n=1 Tax=Plasmodium falciparum UGT5.1 TaxID=1237627 RepID=W7JI24_PLAFA|nr:hypothetical protein C923_04864 [Plasmodium falciparum UGT5.1]